MFHMEQSLDLEIEELIDEVEDLNRRLVARIIQADHAIIVKAHFDYLDQLDPE